jgi:hypothetical protein
VEEAGEDGAVLKILVDHEIKESSGDEPAASEKKASASADKSDETAIMAKPEGELAASQPRSWHRMERVERTHIERRIPLPPGLDLDSIDANLVDGVLTIKCPKLSPAAAPTTRSIKIN